MITNHELDMAKLKNERKVKKKENEIKLWNSERTAGLGRRTTQNSKRFYAE